MRFILSSIILVFLFFSCKKDDPVEPPKIKYDHTIIVVMEANNNLRQYALDNINDMEIAANSFKNAAVLVYLRSNNDEAILLRVKFDEDLKVIASDTIKKYTISSSSPQQLNMAINDSKEFFPAESYGLILWSHATSWAPPISKRIETRSFGEDQGKQMDIIDLKNSIPSGFEYIIFDACNMASIEVLWEFKEKTKYIIASPTEVLASGFPYRKVLPYLASKEPDLINVANQYFEHYSSYTGQMQSASVTLLNTAELSKLSSLCADLYLKNKSVGIPIRVNVQRLDYTADFPVPAFDFVNYLEVNFPLSELDPIKKQMEKTIIYKNATDQFLGKPIKAFSGFTCFIPESEDFYLNYYRTLNWYKDSGTNVLF
ncbi:MULTISPECIES: clostripain-related cysteine peptidase [unclassified Sphingobacterium]|uniref:clostripain-related cysteine peptidase n=1 Tax=unclassified Sphingobacterium TaxID=2609468 RepID=UPI0025DF399B|nr:MULTISPECIES: clostripain-related cysteine peptidase [unclassified Sphingobacterium]